ncbi:MAG: hypothetical protein WCX71_03785 [Candidatus Buchananbacteria bacterium]
MNCKKIKLELFYIRKSIFEYHAVIKYLKNKYFLAPGIIKLNKILEKPINKSDYSIHILTCQRDLIATIWSLASFYSVSKVIGQLYIHNDGTLSQNNCNLLNIFFPSAIIVSNIDLKKSSFLAQYPEIVKFRKNYPRSILLLKLIDPYFISDATYHLVIDSDLVWFNRPKEIEESVTGHSEYSLMASNMTDCQIFFKDGSGLTGDKAKFNSGVVLYKKDNFNLRKLTDYSLKLDIENKKNLHFIEQAGYAYCLENLKLLSPNDYTIKKDYNNQTIVRHYTSPRRPLFYIEGLEILKNNLHD